MSGTVYRKVRSAAYVPSCVLQADTIIPDGPEVDSLNRYAYVYNNPLSYTDPSGHIPVFNAFAAAANNAYESVRQMANKVREATTGVASKIFAGSRLENARNQANYQNFLEGGHNSGVPAGTQLNGYANFDVFMQQGHPS